MNCPSWLGRLAVVVWVSWLGLIALLFAMFRLAAWHPHFLPVTAMLALLLGAGLTLLIGGSWRLSRGPARKHALVCLLLGLPPLGFLAGHLMYGFGTAYGRQFTLSLPLRVLIPFGESILDLVARFQYPVRTQGERVVMISTPVENAQAQVAAMDRHIRALEARLGRSGTRRVHWVRGPILGLQGRALLGMCMGSVPTGGWERPDAEGLTILDRHEVAHVVLTQFCTPDMEPPAILMEGWAEAASVADPKPHRFRFLSEREAGHTLPLEALVGPGWYGRHDYPVYVQGAPLVDYILREFGPHRFVELYAASHPATFAADCRRILGVSIDQLDKDYTADLEKDIGPGGYQAYWLASLELGSGVDPAAWRAFLTDYLAAAKRMLAPYRYVRLVAERSHSGTNANGQTTRTNGRYELTRSGLLRSFKSTYGEIREEAYLARPGQSFRAERKPPAKTWEIHEDPRANPERAYRRIAGEIDQMEPVTSGTVPLMSMADVATTLVNPLCLRVTRLDRFTENGRRYIRLGFEDCPPGHPTYRKITLCVAADDFSVTHEESVGKADDTWQDDAVYQPHEGVPLLQSTRSERRWADGTRASDVLTVVDRKFEPVPEEEFTAERLLGGDPVRHIAPVPEPVQVSGLLIWYQLPIALGFVSLAAGVVLGSLSHKRPEGW